MRADFDSQANALSIDLEIVERWDGADRPIDDDCCHIATTNGRPVNIELLHPSENLGLLDQVAERYALDSELLRAVSTAALAAPDRLVTLELGERPSAA